MASRKSRFAFSGELFADLEKKHRQPSAPASRALVMTPSLFLKTEFGCHIRGETARCSLKKISLFSYALASMRTYWVAELGQFGAL